LPRRATRQCVGASDAWHPTRPAARGPDTGPMARTGRQEPVAATTVRAGSRLTSSGGQRPPVAYDLSVLAPVSRGEAGSGASIAVDDVRPVRHQGWRAETVTGAVVTALLVVISAHVPPGPGG